MGLDHGRTPSQDPDYLPQMPLRHSCRSGRWTPPPGMRTLESRVSGNSHARFGGGQGEKGRVLGTSPAAYPTMTWGNPCLTIPVSRASENDMAWTSFGASLIRLWNNASR